MNLALEDETPTTRFEDNGEIFSGKFIERFESFGLGTIIIAGLIDGINPTQGTVKIGDYKYPEDAKQIKQHLGYLPQEFGLYLSATAYEFLELMGLLYGINNKKRLGGLKIRIINDKEPEILEANVSKVKPSLEDGYMFLLQKEKQII